MTEYCVKNCFECPELVSERKQIVNGVGSMDANIMFVGEAPGEKEDEKGEPFVGRSGEILRDAIQSAGCNTEEVRITNTVRCRPPENRDPTDEEKSNCERYLFEEINSVEPSLIITLGKHPSEQLIENGISVTKSIGEVREINVNGTEFSCMICIHPALTLYQPSYKSEFYDTIKKAINYIED